MGALPSPCEGTPVPRPQIIELHRWLSLTSQPSRSTGTPLASFKRANSATKGKTRKEDRGGGLFLAPKVERNVPSVHNFEMVGSVPLPQTLVLWVLTLHIRSLCLSKWEF
ncbi:hypothetical protein ACFX13_042542 [Malus domestica]